MNQKNKRQEKCPPHRPTGAWGNDKKGRYAVCHDCGRYEVVPPWVKKSQDTLEEEFEDLYKDHTHIGGYYNELLDFIKKVQGRDKREAIRLIEQAPSAEYSENTERWRETSIKLIKND